jgi:hypothetical protein
MNGFVGFAHVTRVAIRVGEYRDARQSELTARTNDANGNLAAVGDQDFHMRLAAGSGASAPPGIFVILHFRL